MKQTITPNQGAHLLLSDSNAKWTYAGALALCEYLEQMESDCDLEIEFNVVDIRCEWHEYESLIEAATDYGWSWEGDADAEDDEIQNDAREWLEYRTTVIPVEGEECVVIQRF